MSPQGTPSETSPLLSPQSNGALPKALNGSITTSILPQDALEANSNSLERHDSIDESRAAQFAGNPEVRKMLKYIVPAVSIGIFLSAADQTIIVSSYAKIGSDLNALNLTSWIGTSYFLTLSSFQPLYGKLSDIFGRKTCLLYAYFIFGLGCLFCGLAQNIYQLIAARVFQGIGGGGMTTVVSIMFSDIVPLKERGMWQGFVNIIYASGAASGAPLGGLLADFIGWRWAFLGQAPLCLLAFLAAWYVIDLPNPDQGDWRKKLRRIDFLGAFILVGAVFGLIFGLDRGSNVSWKKPISYASISTSIALFAIFIYVETCVAAEPFAPGHVIFERSMIACYLCNFFSFGGWIAALFYVPLFYQAVDGLGATGAALRLLPPICAGVSGSLFGGLWMKKFEKYYWLTVFGYTLLPFGMVLVTLFSGVIVRNSYVLILGLVFCAFGNGIGVTTSLIALISNAAPEDQAIATACSYLFRSLGSVVGLSLSASVVQQKLRDCLEEGLRNGKDAEKIEEGVRRSLDFIRTLDPEVRDIVRHCYAISVQYGFALMIIILTGAMISSFFIREKRLSR